jgi:hypothetical protein
MLVCPAGTCIACGNVPAFTPLVGGVCCGIANCCGPFIVGVKLLFGGCIVFIPAGEKAWNAVGNEAPD